ncbi:hypothetical protein ISF_08459 [Cordyceps fumosorosea ARSEF 2679]|uniref:Uncharacterized protein n=1 Tax=Cordyceps fumosorosea (strain ARSEF 2679) TaxID=1081104 RepID=A0A167MDG9_CORFA|nr:hypothetical protein ISF_08459 [Cordyceps fumosorosea ARSEF 2679]OAA54232.1 hypothetical protein ISF_08459 [Cordyceps fumosorosea ARSEF 2679]
MAQPSPVPPANGISSASPDPPSDNSQLSVPGKRKRDDDGEPAPAQHQETTTVSDDYAGKNPEDLLKYYHQVLIQLDDKKTVLTRVLPENQTDQEPQTKRQKSEEPPTRSTISDKFAAKSYTTIDDVAADVTVAIDAALQDVDVAENPKEAVRLRAFRRKALKYVAQEKAYPQIKAEPQADPQTTFQDGSSILSIVGFAPQERRLFSSLPASKDVDMSDVALPPGVSIVTVTRSSQQVPTRTLGELFGSHRALLPLNPPKQPKTQAKGTVIDFYHPEPTNARTNCYFNTKLSSGYYLDYSNAIPSSQAVPKQRERAESLAGKKPSMSELEMSEVESLFRGAFSTFAPSKDDSAAVVPSSVAGRIWWQRSGQQIFERMLDAEYYGDKQNKEPTTKSTVDEIDEAAIQDAIDHWDETAVDPSLEKIMGTQSKVDKDTDDLLGEVSDLIETLASYQRIRNLTLPSSQNRQSSDPVTGDMLANSGPEPSEDEVATYEMLKSQLALIVKTLPPFAVAKLNGDQLDELLISTKIQVQTDDYYGTMEEDEAGVQARLRAQQQQQQQQQQQRNSSSSSSKQQQQQHQQQQAAQHARQPPQRTPSVGGHYPNQYAATAQYGTPGRTPQPQQFYRPGSQPSFQAQRNATPQQPRPPQPNQYTRANGFPGNQYATQLAKAQTPYGHQNMPQYANQQRQQFAQTPQPQAGPPNTATYHQYQPHQQGVAPPANYAGYTNGTPQQHAQHPQPQQQRQMYSQSPNMQTQQRFATPTPQPGTPGQGARYAPGPNQPAGYNQSPGLTGYHTVISEAQQQRIIDQAKARVAAGGQQGSYPSATLVAARANMTNQQKPQTPTPTGQRSGTPTLLPHKVTPVPVPPIPGAMPQQPQL